VLTEKSRERAGSSASHTRMEAMLVKVASPMAGSTCRTSGGKLMARL